MFSEFYNPLVYHESFCFLNVVNRFARLHAINPLISLNEVLFFELKLEIRSCKSSAPVIAVFLQCIKFWLSRSDNR